MIDHMVSAPIPQVTSKRDSRLADDLAEFKVPILWIAS
jgi:hypothetical protein